jgi:hypothetical protein
MDKENMVQWNASQPLKRMKSCHLELYVELTLSEISQAQKG